jgi:hypothetical protein
MIELVLEPGTAGSRVSPSADLRGLDSEAGKLFEHLIQWQVGERRIKNTDGQIPVLGRLRTIVFLEAAPRRMLPESADRMPVRPLSYLEMFGDSLQCTP